MPQQKTEHAPSGGRCFGPEIIKAMRAAAPPGRSNLSDQQSSELAYLTQRLIDLRDGPAESRRFHNATRRSLIVPSPPATAHRTVVVTGGTGCIGTAVLRELVTQPNTRVVSLSRGLRSPVSYVPGVEYRTVDIRSEVDVSRAFNAFRPDVVYHLAAVRDPALAEIEVLRTVATNILGTANLVAAAKSVGVHTFVYASTGKAVRFFTSDVYAATKKIGESLVANSGLPVRSFVRYTHVADNSLIMQKLATWGSGKLVRLHDPDIAFYVQSARESAQLLVVAERRSGFYSIRDLDWPISLLDLALGVMQESRRLAPIYFCGYEPGYESSAYPGLYDPEISGETGPLVNITEAHAATATLGEQLNRVPVVEGDADICEQAVATLRSHCEQYVSLQTMRAYLDDISWSLLDAMLSRTPSSPLVRLAELATRYPSDNREHDRITQAILGKKLERSQRHDQLVTAAPQ